MKKVFGLLVLFFMLVLVGCSNSDAKDSSKEGEASQEEESTNKEYGENTIVVGEKVETPIELHQGDSFIVVHPETDYTSEKSMEITLNGVDYLDGLETEGFERYDYIVMHVKVDNIGENKISVIDFPRIKWHTPTGQEDSASFVSNGDFNIKTIENTETIPGGTLEGVILIPVDNGLEMDSLYFEPDYIGNEGLPPVVINTDHLHTTAGTEIVQLSEELNQLREEFFRDEFSEYDNLVVDASQAEVATIKLENYGLSAEPNDIHFSPFDEEVYYLAEYILDENGYFQGITFTEE